MFTAIRYPFLGFVEVVFMNCIFLGKGFSPVYRWNSVEFSVDFRELDYFRNLLSNRLGVRISIFQTGYDILMPCEFLIGF